MAWTATLSKKSLLDGDAVVTVTYSDDVSLVKFDETYRIRGARAGTFLQEKVRDRIKELVETQAWVDGLTDGAIAPASDPAPAPAPTAADLAQAAWLTKYRKLQAFKRAIDVGIESPTFQAYVDMQADVIATRLAGYRQLY